MKARWGIRDRLVLVVSVAAAAPSLAIAYWVVSWLSDGVPLQQAVAIVAGWTAAVALAAAVYGLVAARRVVGPLEDLTRALRAFDPSLGDTGHAALVERDDEPRETADLKRALRGAVERIGRDRAQKEAVLAGLMHDLKTPLVAQRLLIEQVPRLDAHRAAAAVEQLQRTTSGAIARLNRLIDVLRVDAVDGHVAREPCDLRAIVERAIADLRVLAAAQNVVVTVEGDWVTTSDAARIERAVENVLANAVRHARTGVDVVIHPGVVLIGDDGPGFAAPFDELVDPFRPGPASSERADGTAGLGLYIARRSLEAVGGRLKLGVSRSGRTVVHLYIGVGGP